MPHKRIRHDLKDQRGKWSFVGGGTLFNDIRIIRQEAFDGRNVDRRGQKIHHRVQQILDAFVFERTAADHRKDLLRDGRLADALQQLCCRDRRTLNELLKQVVVGFRYRLDQLLPIRFGFFQKIGGDFHFVVLGAQGLVAPDSRFHRHQVDDALELVLGSHRDLNRHRPALQPIHDGIDGVVKIRSHAVHFVDEADARNAVFIGLAPHRLRLRLHARHGVKHGHRAVQNAQTALHFRGEIHVAGRIDNVDGDIAPFAGGGGRGDGDAALLFLLHPIHNGRAFMHFANFVRTAGVIKDAFRSGSFAGINVGHDADISHPVGRYGTHKNLSSGFSPSIMRKGLVGLRHPVDVILLLDCSTAHVRGIV